MDWLRGKGGFQGFRHQRPELERQGRARRGCVAWDEKNRKHEKWAAFHDVV
jgi:hypothetical protein